MLNIDNLHNYQTYAVEKIISNNRYALLLDMGLGKTVSSLTSVNILMNEELDISTCLIIAPKRVVESVWAEECEKWSHLKNLKCVKIIGNEKKRVTALKTKADVYIVSRDNISWLIGYYGGSKLPYDMIIIDELSSFKNHRSIRFQSLSKATKFAKRVVGLTGTPAPNGLIDLWAQFFLIDGGERLGSTIGYYREVYFKPDKMNGHVVYKYKPCEDSEEKIYSKISDICISMKATDHLNMPDLVFNNVFVGFDDDLSEMYNKFEEEQVLLFLQNNCSIEDADAIEISAVNAAVLNNKLTQFCNGAVYDDERNIVPIHDRKLEALKDIIEDSNGQPIFVAYTFVHDKVRMMEYLKEYKPRELKTNQDINDWNAGKIRVLLAHPASAGHGLNLQKGGHIIVWFSCNYSLELYEQFNSRIYRQGQSSKTVIIHRLLISTSSADHDVVLALDGKQETQNKLIDAVKARIDKYKHKLLKR